MSGIGVSVAKTVTTDDGLTYRGRILVLATGSERLGDEAEGDGPVGEDHSTTAGRAPGTPDGQDPERIAATTGGEGFCLADCVQALCESVLVRAA